MFLIDLEKVILLCSEVPHSVSSDVFAVFSLFLTILFFGDQIALPQQIYKSSVLIDLNYLSKEGWSVLSNFFENCFELLGV